MRAELRRAARQGTALRINHNASLGDKETLTLNGTPRPHSANGDLSSSNRISSNRISSNRISPHQHAGQRMGRESEHGGGKVHLPAIELKEEQQSTASQLPGPAAHKVLQAKEAAHGPRKHSAAGSRDEDAAMEGELFESKVERRLRSMVPNGALRGFVARVARAVRKDCRLPHLQPHCTKMLEHTVRLVGLMGRERHTEQCVMGANSSASTESRNRTAEHAAPRHSSRRILLAVLVSLIITAYLTAICLIEVCCPKPTAASQPHSTSKSQWRCFRSFRKLLPRRWRRNGAQGSHSAERMKDEPRWLRELYLPLDERQKESIHRLYREPGEEGGEEEEELFSGTKPMAGTAAEEQRSPNDSSP
ncbi:leucine-rich repeat-containing protein 37B isoform X1 [Excalfactoria chinensis]|uniref:leucine-rich repeat-containing protein 37B isoform X1 n=1 Tax=Excalfactoria chinensis TaxID=46218 RepID=UPI003B3BC096